MSTFEGPMMAIKTINALSHYTDWTIGHVHSGALGWVAFITIGSMYLLCCAIKSKWFEHRIKSTCPSQVSLSGKGYNNTAIILTCR
jgi:cytochrome c oxidase cbb3-type subunit 1